MRIFEISGDDFTGQVTFLESKELTKKQDRAITRAAVALDPTRFADSPPEHVAALREYAEQNGIVLGNVKTKQEMLQVIVDASGGELPIELLKYAPRVDGDVLDTLWASKDVIITTRIHSWTLDRPLPTTVEAFEDLPLPVANELERVVDELLGEEQEHDRKHGYGPDAVQDPASPSGDSGA